MGWEEEGIKRRRWPYTTGARSGNESIRPSVCRSVVRPSILPSAAFIFIVLLLLLVAGDVIRIAGMETNGELERERASERGRDGVQNQPATMMERSFHFRLASCSARFNGLRRRGEREEGTDTLLLCWLAGCLLPSATKLCLKLPR